MTQGGSQFEHDDLRQALRRVFPPEQAPQALRNRIAAMLRDEEVWFSGDMPVPAELTQPAGPITHPSAPANPYARIAWLGNLFHGARRVAIAACVAGLAMGATLFLVTSSSTAPDQPQVAGSAQVSPFIQAALFRHDELLQAPDPSQMPGGSLVPLPQLRSDIQGRSGTPMPDADISSEGWRLVGGKSWQAASFYVTQIFYRRGRDTLSVFIIPPDSLGRRVQIGSTNERSHPITIRQTARFTLCIVGYSPDGKVTTGEIDRVADLIASH